jgi:hypothetical protein
MLLHSKGIPMHEPFRSLVGAVRRTRAAVLFFIAALAPFQVLTAQEFEFETQFATNEEAEAPCPPSFMSVYHDDTFGVFWGSSRMTMAQQDQYHTYSFYTYEFSGKTSDRKTGVKGIHHVNAAQCSSAAYSY